ncbi:MAG TPA: alpha/beta family hydrolase [Methylocella sp.]|nr:alpha/beta family hydrolase [Methylocella sp.]
MPDKMRVEVAPDQDVTALVYPAANRDQTGVTLILGHGAGADQTSSFMTRFATDLAARGVNTVTFNFLYTEQGRRIPDTNNKLEACFQVVSETVRKKKIGCGTLVIGGKSMGGRIASQIAAAGANVEGLVFLGYPLHPPGKVDQLRAKHLSDIKVPILFVQGSRDAFGTPDELRQIIKKLKAATELYVVEGGDHSFKVSKRAGIKQDDAYQAVLDRIELWLRQTIANR